MTTSITKRLLLAFITVFLALSITFFLTRKMPGDIFHAMALDKMRTEGIPFEVAYERVMAMYGMAGSEPLYKQYFAYLGNTIRGRLGTSVYYHISVNKIIAKAIPWTVFVCSISILLSFVIGSLLGTVIAWKRKTMLDPIASAYASITDATPSYITATILLIIFAVNLKWFPLKGAYSVDVTPGFNLLFIWSVLYHATLPILAYTIQSIGGWILTMKASAISVLGEDYVSAAKARGLKERRIAISYVGRNAVLAPFTSLAIVFGAMLGGATLIESVFAYPGMGFFFGKAVALRDYPLMQGLFLLTIGGVILATLLADFLYALIDPRVRKGG
ncbi:MAG: ABC transporter permease [bacterium]|nr:ABC transporter permease [bacterium]